MFISKLIAALSCLTLFVVPGSLAFAQTEDSLGGVIPSRTWLSPSIQPPPPEVFDEWEAHRLAEVRAWVELFTEWQEWSARVGNQSERGWFTSYRNRREKPAPPAWLRQYCDTSVDLDGPMVPACALLAESNTDPAATRARDAENATRAELEAPMNRTWWEHLHVDLLWPAMQWQTSTYGVVGTHTAISVKGRWEVFVTPGAMLLNLPSANGSRAWKIATNYGMGYRLADFTLFGNRPVSLHVNFAKAWLLSDASDVALGKTTDFIGFSMTFRKDR